MLQKEVGEIDLDLYGLNSERTSPGFLTSLVLLFTKVNAIIPKWPIIFRII